MLYGQRSCVPAGCEISPHCSCLGSLHPTELPNLPVCVGGTSLGEAMEGEVLLWKTRCMEEAEPGIGYIGGCHRVAVSILEERLIPDQS